MRPMRLGKRAVTDPAQIRAIIEACQVLRLGVVDAEGMFIVPVNFGYVWEADQELPCFYLHSAREGRKADAFYAGGDRGVPVAFDPISAICARMLRFEPCPMASMVMTEATPMMIPNIVRKHRILLLLSALSAILVRLVRFIMFFLIGFYR